MSAWEEIRKLQAMLSEVQQIDSSQKLSERNCVEIMTKLIELGLVDVVHTLDGREYVTNDQIGREIREEVALRGGRSEFGELQTALNIDVTHVQKKVEELTRREKRTCELQVVLGQLVTTAYLDRVADELVDELNTTGSLRYADVAKRYDLPAEFVRDALGDRLARRVRVRVDEATATVYTACFYETHTRKLRGALGAALHPVPLASLCASLGLHERVALGALEDAVKTGAVRGEVVGSSGSSLQNATFVPEVYSRTQKEFVANALRTRRFVDFATLARINLSDATGAYLRRNFGHEFQLQLLDQCAVTQDAVELCEATCEDCVRSATGCVDLSSVLPSGMPHDDVCTLVNNVVRRLAKTLADESLSIVQLENWQPAPFDADGGASESQPRQSAVFVRDATLIGSRLFGDTWSTLAAHLDAKALADAESDQFNRPAFLQRLRTRLAGVTSASAGVKKATPDADEPSKRSHFGKATKKKYNPHGKGGRAAQRDDDEPEDEQSDERAQKRTTDADWLVEGLRRFELQETVNRAFSDVSDDSALNSILTTLHREANNRYQLALCAALRNKQSAAASTQADSEGDRRKRYQRLLETLQSRSYILRLAQRGCDTLNDTLTACASTSASAQSTTEQVGKHVLRTIGVEIFQTLVAVAIFDQLTDQQDDQESGRSKWTLDQIVNLDAERVTAEVRVSWVEQVGVLHKELRAPFAKLAQTISKPVIGDFVTQFEAVCAVPILQLSIKKLDNKTEKNVLLEYKHSNLEKLNTLLQSSVSSAQLADALQLAVALLFNAQTKSILHVPQRVSRIVLEHVIAPLFTDLTELEPLSKLGASTLKSSGESQDAASQSDTQIDQETRERVNQLIKSAFQRNWKAGRSN